MRVRNSILGVLVAMVSGCSLAETACSARTPEQALPSGWVAATTEAASDSPANFYRLVRIVVDPELHRRWALIANCTHPERPLQIVALSAEQPTLPTPPAPALPLASPARTVAPHIVQAEGMHHPQISLSPSGRPPTAPIPMSPSTPSPSAMVPVIRAGDLVRLWGSDANVRLEMEVVSLEYGHVGQIIHVRRMGQTALLAAVVVGTDSAELIP